MAFRAAEAELDQLDAIVNQRVPWPLEAQIETNAGRAQLERQEEYYTRLARVATVYGSPVAAYPSWHPFIRHLCTDRFPLYCGVPNVVAGAQPVYFVNAILFCGNSFQEAAIAAAVVGVPEEAPYVLHARTFAPDETVETIPYSILICQWKGMPKSPDEIQSLREMGLLEAGDTEADIQKAHDNMINRMSSPVREEDEFIDHAWAMTEPFFPRLIPRQAAVNLFLDWLLSRLPLFRSDADWYKIRQYVLGEPCGQVSSHCVSQDTGYSLRTLFETIQEERFPD